MWLGRCCLLCCRPLVLTAALEPCIWGVCDTACAADTPAQHEGTCGEVLLRQSTGSVVPLLIAARAGAGGLPLQGQHRCARVRLPHCGRRLDPAGRQKCGRRWRHHHGRAFKGDSSLSDVLLYSDLAVPGSVRHLDMVLRCEIRPTTAALCTDVAHLESSCTATACAAAAMRSPLHRG